MNKQLIKLAFAAKAVLRAKAADANADIRFSRSVSDDDLGKYLSGRDIGLESVIPSNPKRIRAILDSWNEDPIAAKDPVTNGYRVGFRRKLVGDRLGNKDLKGSVKSEDGGALTSSIAATTAGAGSGSGIGALIAALRKSSKRMGAGVGGTVGGALSLLSALAANAVGDSQGRNGKLRSLEDQRKYEEGSKWGNRLIPGMANYNKHQSVRQSDFV